jgi:hypothetical protein
MIWSLRSSDLFVAALAVAAFAGAACSPRRNEWNDAAAQRQAAALLGHFGVAGDLTAQIAARVSRPDADPVSFTIHLWAAADGRVRVAVRKVDVAVLSAVIAADGAVVAKAERTGGWYRGPAGEVLAEVQRLVAELRHGPLRHGIPVTAGADGTLVQEQDGQAARLRLERGLVTTKTWDGYELTYGQEKDFAGLFRAEQFTVRAEAGGGFGARLVRFAAVPELDPGRLTLTPPADAVWLDRDGLAAALR